MTAEPQAAEAVARTICEIEDLEFVSLRGSGAFKHTFHVRRPDGEDQALKIFKGAFNIRSSREIDAMQRCQHPNIGRFVSAHEFDQDGGKVYYSIEEFLGGGSLSERLGTGPLTPESFYEIGRQLIDALVHLESLDLVHRDIKPDNIMFRDNGDTPVIVDFGLVRDLQASSVTESWQMRGPGTPLFASPEQLNNEKQMINWRSDQFGLGVTLSFAFLGFHPYADEGDSMQTVVQLVAQRSAPSDRFVEITKEKKLDALRKMVQPWPIGRFRTAAELLEAWEAENV